MLNKDSSYADFQNLADSLEQYGIEKTSFQELLSFIAPPPQITSFLTILINLGEVLPVLERILAFHPDLNKTLLPKIADWNRICSEIITHRATLSVTFPTFDMSFPNSYTPPYRGNYQTHPLGVALWCSVGNQDLKSRYSLLQAYMALTIFLLQNREDNPLKSKPSIIYGSCLKMRQFSAPKTRGPLPFLPDLPMKLGDYKRALDDLDNDELLPISALLKLLIEYKRPRHYRGRKSTAAHDKNPLDRVEEIAIEQESTNEKAKQLLTVYTVSQGNSRRGGEYRSTLVSPLEFKSAQEFFAIKHDGPDPSGSRSPAQMKMEAKGLASAYAMKNQRHSNDWDDLTPFEIEMFLRSIIELASGDQHICGIRGHELAAYLGIVLWTSAAPDIAHKIKLVPQPAKCKDLLGLHREKDGSYYWVIKPHVPKQSNIPEKILKGQALLLARRYVLPVPPEAERVLLKHLSSISITVEPVRIFSGKPGGYLKSATEFINTLRAQHRFRLTLRRISEVLHKVVARLAGSDISLAMALTGRADQVGNVSHFYTAHSLVRLEIYYQKACTAIRELAGLPTGSQLIEPRDTGYYVGSKYVPKEKTVKDLVTGMVERLEFARQKVRLGVADAPLRLHNDLTVYTIMLIGFATGYRAVADPLLQDAEIDHETGFCVISDKDGEDYYHTRIIWLPTICLDQLDLYRNHLNALQEWLFTRNLDLYFAARQTAVTGKSGIRQYPLLFLLKEDMSGVSVQPRYLTKLLAQVPYAMKINSNRHYLKTTLLQSGCPTEVLSAFLGHWERGLESWGKYSGLSPLVYRQELSGPLVKLLKNDGWKTQSGFNRRRSHL
jgi:hypothetical protein